MTDDDRKRAAQAILEVPFFTALFDEIEQASTNQCINAQINDDDTRRNAAAEVRAIRRVRQRLEALAGQSDAGRRAPA